MNECHQILNINGYVEVPKILKNFAKIAWTYMPPIPKLLKF